MQDEELIVATLNLKGSIFIFAGHLVNNVAARIHRVPHSEVLRDFINKNLTLLIEDLRVTNRAITLSSSISVSRVVHKGISRGVTRFNHLVASQI